MPRMEDLRQSVSKMSVEELQDLFVRIREDRKVRKETKKTKVAKVKSGEKAKTNLQKLLDSMTETERAQLLRELEA